jgi:hypothetical protein
LFVPELMAIVTLCAAAPGEALGEGLCEVAREEAHNRTYASGFQGVARAQGARAGAWGEGRGGECGLDAETLERNLLEFF